VVYLATVPTADTAYALVHELTQGETSELSVLAHHLRNTKLFATGQARLLGARLTFRNRPEGGAETELRLPTE
jgi:hypothetical protein